MTAYRTFGYFGLLSLIGLAAVPTASQETATDPEIMRSNQQKAKSEAETQAYVAAKARSEAETAAAKARFGSLADYTTEGKVEAGENSGKLEAALLAAEATRSSAQRIVADLCNSNVVGQAAAMCDESAAGSVHLIILTDADKPTFDAYDAFKLQLDSINAELRQAFKGCSAPSGTGLVGSQVVSLPGIATAVDIAANLLRSDYKLSYLELSQTDALLVKAFLQQARVPTGQHKIKARIVIPSLFPQRIDLGTDGQGGLKNSALNYLQGVRTLRDTVSDCVKAAGKGKKGTPNPRVAAMTKAVERFDAFESKLATADDAGAVPLATIARQAQLTSLLDRPNTYMLQLKADMAGGSAYSKKSFATFLGEMPFSVSGGSLVSYALLTGSGDVVYADVLAQTQPFMKIHDATERFVAGRPK